jgi:hypothetical protein
VAVARRSVDGRGEGSESAITTPTPTTMFDGLHSEALGRLSLKRGSEAIAAERLPGLLAGRDETQWHCVQLTALLAAGAGDIGELVHP